MEDLTKKDYEDINTWLCFLAYGIPDETLLSEKQKREVMDLATKCFNKAY